MRYLKQVPDEHEQGLLPRPQHPTRPLESHRSPWVEGEPVEDSNEILRYLHLLALNKGKILALAFLGFVGAVFFSVSQTPLYRARISVEIQAPVQSSLSNQRGSNFEAMSDIQTQVRLLRSASLINRALRKMDPSQVPTPTEEDAGKLPESSSGANSASTQVNHSNETSPVSFSAWKAVRSTVLGFFTPSRPVPPQARALGMAAGTVRVQPTPNTRVVEISCSSTDPAIAARFLNLLVDEFILQGIENRWQTYQRAGEWLDRANQELKAKLEESEQRLQEYARNSNLIFTGETNNVAEEKLRQLQAELSKATADRIASESQYKLAMSSSPESLAQVSDQGALADYRVRLTDLRRQLAELSATLTPSHYKVARVQAQIDEVEAGLRKERENALKRIRNQYEAALGRERLLAASYAAQSGVVTDQTEKAIHYNMLRREVETNRKLYETALQRGKEASVESAFHASNIRVIDTAKRPRFPYQPNILKNLGVGILLGIFLAVAFVLGREFLNRSIKVPGEAPSWLNVPELGVIPSSSLNGGWGLAQKLRALLPSRKESSATGGRTEAVTALEPVGRGTNVELVTWQDQPSLLAESFRSTLASILFADHNGQRPKVIVVTSPSAGEGKTTVLSNLGIVIAESGQQVLLVDADMRRPRLNKVYGRTNTWGLSDLLREQTPIESYPRETLARPTDVPGLHLLPSGPPTENPSHLIHSTRMTRLLDRLRKEVDMILIDTPPMMQISDARVLSRIADASILVIRSGRTSQATAQAALQRLVEDGSAVLGTILNDWDPKATASNYAYDYKYYYKST